MVLAQMINGRFFFFSVIPPIIVEYVQKRPKLRVIFLIWIVKNNHDFLATYQPVLRRFSLFYFLRTEDDYHHRILGYCCRQLIFLFFFSGCFALQRHIPNGFVWFNLHIRYSNGLCHVSAEQVFFSYFVVCVILPHMILLVGKSGFIEIVIE